VKAACNSYAAEGKTARSPQVLGGFPGLPQQ
jgi:hypothetical protein